MSTLINTKNFEIFLLGFLGLSVFISKSGLYIATSLSILYFAYLIISSKEKREKIASSFISKFCISLYLIGFISCVIYPHSSNDVIYFLRKGIFLLLLPAMLLIINTNKKLHIITSTLLISASIAILYSFYHLSEIGISNWNGQRVTSFWDVGRWSELLGYLIAFIFPFALYNKNRKLKTLIIIIFTLAFISLLISGSRGPLLALAITIFIYLIFNNRNVLLLTPIILCAISYSLSLYSPLAYNQIHKRIESITNVTTDDSNSARIDMWDTAISFSSYNLDNNKMAFIFGTGNKNHQIEFSNYLKNYSNLDKLKKDNNDQFSINDHHNAYLDNLIKMGLIYSSLYLALILYILKHLYNRTNNNRTYSWAGVNVVVTFLITGFFYTNQLSLQTICFTVIIAVPIAWVNLQNKIKPD